MSLILASASATRAKLLRDAGVPFEIVPADVDEDAIKHAMLKDGATAKSIVMALAEAKAFAVSRANPGRIVLGADQVLDFGGIVSKSHSLEEAHALLSRLRGARHILRTAAVLARDGAPLAHCYDEAGLVMREFSEEFLDAYLAQEGEQVLASVGCFRLEGRGLQLFSTIDGDYFTILGLPMLPLLTALRQQGILSS